MVGSIQLSCRRKGMSRLRMLFSRPSIFYEQPKEVEWPATKMLHNCSRLSGQKYNRRLSTFFNQHFEFFLFSEANLHWKCEVSDSRNVRITGTLTFDLFSNLLLSRSLSLYLSLSHTHTHTRTLKNMHAHINALPRAHTHTHTHTRTLSFFLTHSLSIFHGHLPASNDVVGTTQTRAQSYDSKNSCFLKNDVACARGEKNETGGKHFSSFNCQPDFGLLTLRHSMEKNIMTKEIWSTWTKNKGNNSNEKVRLALIGLFHSRSHH